MMQLWFCEHVPVDRVKQPTAFHTWDRAELIPGSRGTPEMEDLEDLEDGFSLLSLHLLELHGNTLW